MCRCRLKDYSLLIEPFGIETRRGVRQADHPQRLLIEPFGIETRHRRLVCHRQQRF